MAQYTSQFKLKVAKEAIKAKTYSEVERKYGVSSGLVKKWADAYAQYGEMAFEANGPLLYQDQRIRELERQIADLKEENAILKKATAYFSRNDQ